MNFTYLFFYGKIHLRALVPITSLRGAFAPLLGGELRLSSENNILRLFSFLQPTTYGRRFSIYFTLK